MIDRRSVVVGAAALAAGASFPGGHPLAGDDYIRFGRVHMHTEIPYPDDMKQWPERYQAIPKAAFQEFAKANPDAKPIAEYSERITYGDSRFEPLVRPDGSRLEFALLYTVEFDRPVWDPEHAA